VEASGAPWLQSVRNAQLALTDSGPDVDVVVRHMTPVPGAPDGQRMLVGLEFVRISPAARTELERLVREWNDAGES
jgi:hypothetical protein